METANIGLNQYNHHGFTLIEVLVSVVVLSIGLLGIAGLQLSLIRYNHSAQMRSIAITQVNNMIERMRANYVGVGNGEYNNISGIPAVTNCTQCTTGQIAVNDAHEWNSNNARYLPSGQGTVINNGNNLYTITMRWDNDRLGASGTACSGNPKVDLSCLIFQVQL